MRGAPLTPLPGGRALCLQSSTQEIGEELVNGLIYSISLRKVQLPHGGSKGQRWLGVSAGGPRTPRRAHVPRASLATPRGSLPGLSCPWAPQPCSQRDLGPAPPPRPAWGVARCEQQKPTLPCVHSLLV